MALTRSTLLVSLFSLALSFAHGQPPPGGERELPLERIFSKPYLAGSRPNSAKISPDERMIIYRWDSTAQNKYNYWMVHADGSALHMLADSLLGGIEWAPDSKTVACTRKEDIYLTDSSFGI